MAEIVGATTLWIDTEAGNPATPVGGRLDPTQPGNGNAGAANFSTDTSSRWLQLQMTGTTSGSGVTPAPAANGWLINSADFDATAAAPGGLPANRIVQAQNIVITGEINSTAALGGNATIRAILSKRLTGGTLSAELASADSAAVSLAASGLHSWTVTVAIPQVAFSAGQSLHLTLFVFAQGVSVTGQTVTMRRGVGAASLSPLDNKVVPSGSGYRYDYLRDYSGSASSSGALSRQPGKALAGSVASAGSLTRIPALLRTGTLTPSGAVVRQASLHYAGAVASSGALIKQLQRRLTGDVATSGSLTRQTNKTLTGSTSPAGALSRLPQILRTGTVSTSGALVKQAQLRLAGVQASAGSLYLLYIKNTVGTITPTGTHQGLLTKNFFASITSTGQVLKTLFLSKTGTVASAGSLLKQAQKRLAGFFYSTGSGGPAPVIRKVISYIFDD